MAGKTPLQRCQAMLEVLGFTHITIQPARGFWRSSRYADCYRWEFTALHRGRSVAAGCWETMTACVKAGALVWSSKEGEVWPVKK